MSASLSPAIVLRAIQEEREKRKAETYLAEFVRQAWPIIEPGVEFVDNWHLHVICEHLQAITDGEIRDLLINMPPRHAKSTIVAVMWPCWEWISRPEEKYLHASYSALLTTRDNIKSRRLIMSNWYQERWGDRYSLAPDQNQKTRFENDRTGYRIASSVGGTATGEGGSRLLLDDPHNAQEAQSDVVRESDIEWFNQVWSSRRNDPKRDARITVMQRLHERDVSGRILELGGWEHLCLPAEWDGVKRSTALGAYDPRTNPGDLLWPARFGEAELTTLKAQLGDYGTAGQLQQRPSPAGGGILKAANFRLWPAGKTLPALEHVVQSYDTAYTADTFNDPTAHTTWGIFRHDGMMNVILLDAWSEHLEYPELRQRVIRDWHATYGGTPGDVLRKPRRADVVLIEKKSSGQSLLQDLRQARVPCVPYDPAGRDKVSRAHQVTPILELGAVFVMESTKERGQPVTWARPFIQQCERFPNDAHDDYVDTFTQAMIYLRDGRWFDLPQAAEDEIEEVNYEAERRKRINPYAS